MLLVCLLPGLLAGCGSSGPTQRDQFFTLQPQVRITPSTQTLPASVLITPLASHGFLGGTQILFRTAADPLQVQRYHHLLWEEVPGRAIAAALISALRTAGAFEYVVSVADRAQADFMLNGELTRLEHLPTADPPQVSAAFNLTLIANHNRSIQFAQSYSGQEPTTASTPQDMARAFNRLLARLLSQAVDDIQRRTPRLGRVLPSGD
ncbi:ABC-type transport auxiliary lipoprotein family protein [Halochromatium sp.]